MMWFGWGFWMFGPICLVLVAIGAYLLVTSNWGHQHHHPTSTPTNNQSKKALEILKTRYAKGELTREQFKEMQKELQ